MEKLLLPNSTQIPNIILDLVLPFLPENEARCLLYICRRTYGFRRDSDKIALSQFVKGMVSTKKERLDFGTGLSATTVKRSLKILEQAGMIVVKRSKRKGLHDSNMYRVNLDMNIEESLKVVKELRIELRTKWKDGGVQMKLFMDRANGGPMGGRATGEPNGRSTSDTPSRATAGPYNTKGNQEKLSNTARSKKSRAPSVIFYEEKEEQIGEELKAETGEVEMDVVKFYEWTKQSPQRHVQIIGEWADTIKPDLRTKEQWQAFLKRNLRTAKELEAFSEDQLAAGFEKIEKSQKEGWLKKFTLETLLKFVTE